MPTELLIFYVLGAGALLSTAAMLLPTTGRNPIHAALLLIVSFFFLAALYALLSAHLLAILQIIVYAGAVMVLFTFVIMLLNLSPDEIREPKISYAKIVGGGLGLFVFGKLLSAIGLASASAKAVDLGGLVEVRAEHAKFLEPTHMYEQFGSVREVGHMMYSTFLVPFELVSVLLLVAAVGAVVLAKKNLAYVDHPVGSPAKEFKVETNAQGHDEGDAGHGGHH